MYFLFICNEPKRSYRLYAFMIQNIMRKFLSFRLQFHVILSYKFIVVSIKSDRAQAPDNRTLEFIAFYVTNNIILQHTTTPNTTPMMIFHT